MAHYAAINHDFGFVAVFSPKCASSAVRAWLADALTFNGAWPRPDRPFSEFGGIDLSAVADHPDLLTIAFLRDPVRRLVSYHALFVVGGDDDWAYADHAREVDLRGCTFRQVVAAVADVVRSGRRLQHHLVPQVDGLPAGTVFDEVVVVERFDVDLARVNHRIGNTAPGPWHANELRYTGPDVPAADRPPAWFREHGLPRPERFVDDDLVTTISEIYKADVAWYLSLPGTALLEPSSVPPAQRSSAVGAQDPPVTNERRGG